MVDAVNQEIANQVLAAVYPAGNPPQPPVAGAAVTVLQGWPLPEDLDAMVRDFNTSAVERVLVAVYPRPGMFRNTSRYPSKWKELSRPAKTLTATVADINVTLGGTADPVQNFALIVGFGSAKQAFVYQTQTGDTLDTVAAAMAALVNAATTATATGPVISIPSAWSLTARVGITGTVTRELRRQCSRFDINVWAPSPALRDDVGSPIQRAFARFDYLTLDDGFAARVRACDDQWIDDPEKAGLFRRLLSYDVDYATTETMPAAEIVVFQSSNDGGQVPEDAPTLVFPI